MSFPVKLYVYDLSNGLARQLSRQLTGNQMDGIWHTSVVLHGKEVFYGQGISITEPGQSHHGRPHQIIDMGKTEIDEETFNEYIQEMRNIYTANKYHLLGDCIGFLTGGSIPSFIKDLPSDFLSTPFGASLRPTIDAMYRRPVPGAATAPAALNNETRVADLLQTVVSATDDSTSITTSGHTVAAGEEPGASTVAASLQICSNLRHFRSILSNHRVVTAFFTSRTCTPCKVIEPVFESLAADKASPDIAFVKTDLGHALGGEVARAYGVRVTPTFLFFLDGKKQHEVTGANAAELRTQIDLLLFEAFPPHPHTKHHLPALRSIELKPILFSQAPALGAIQSKLFSFVDEVPLESLTERDKDKAKATFRDHVLPLLNKMKNKSIQDGYTNMDSICSSWAEVTAMLIKVLDQGQIFPLADTWRLGILDNVVSNWCAEAAAASHRIANPVALFLNYVDLSTSPASMSSLSKPTLLTILRLLSNCFQNPVLARWLLGSSTLSASALIPPTTSISQQALTRLLLGSLMHEDNGVRTAAASLAFNISCHYQKLRVKMVRSKLRPEGRPHEEVDSEWEVELVSMLVEAIRNENVSEDVVYRLTASLAFLVHLSPFYESQLKPLLEVIQAQDILKGKLSGNSPEGFGGKGVTKKEARALIVEVADRLC